MPPPATEFITCPECGTTASVTLNRRDSVDFCRTCDYPLFWTPSKIIRDPSDSSDESLRRLPGTVGRATVASLACPFCYEPNALSAQTCVRCGKPMHPVAEIGAAPVYVPPPAPELPAPEGQGRLVGLGDAGAHRGRADRADHPDHDPHHRLIPPLDLDGPHEPRRASTRTGYGKVRVVVWPALRVTAWGGSVTATAGLPAVPETATDQVPADRLLNVTPDPVSVFETPVVAQFAGVGCAAGARCLHRRPNRHRCS